jgi:hypothetical protein
MFSSNALISYSIASAPNLGSVPYNAARALPLIKTALSPSYSY